jgi:O-Antigen ligase
MVIWPRVAGLLLIGYITVPRSFAYIGLPPLKIFMGEIALAAFLLLKPRVVLGTWAGSLLRASPLSTLGLVLLMFVAYGIWQAGRGVLGGSSVFYTLKFFIFNYYPLYLFLGIWVALNAPDILPRLIRVAAWVYGVYGLIWLIALKYVTIKVPGADVRLFNHPGDGAIVILGLLCFERNLRAVWPVLALNIMITLFMQVRAQWLGLALGILVWGILTRRFGRVMAMGMAGLAVLGMIELAGGNFVGRTGGVSLGATLARVIAPFDAELAQQFSPEAERHASTAVWREKWWESIWISVHSSPMLEAFGHGYGFDLFGLAPMSVRGDQTDWEVRTPHSVFYYALGYTGWVGVALFVALQAAILKLLWRSFRLTGQPAGLVFWVLGMSAACFEQSFETPYKAIPFYLLMGMGIAPGLQPRREWDARPARAQFLPVAGR